MTATATIAERARVFRATYSDWKLIKTRQVVQVIFEVPLEASDAAYDVLGGMPKPAKEAWFGIAPISEQGGEAQNHAGHMVTPGTAPVTRTGGPPIKERRRFDDLPIATQAVLWCQEPAFWKFLQEKYPTAWSQFCTQGSRYEDAAAGTIRHICKVNSRGSIHADNPFWRNFVAGYQAWKLV